MTTKLASRQIKKNEIDGTQLHSNVGIWDKDVGYLSNRRIIWLGRFWRSNTATLARDEPGVSSKWDEVMTDISQEKIVNQNAHGFTVGNIVFSDGVIYAKARADNASTIGFLMVVEVVDVNTFVVTMSGYIEGLSGFTAGQYYYLSNTVAGELTSTEPLISVLLFFAEFSNEGFLLPYRATTTIADTRLETQSTKTANYTISGSDYVIFADAASNTVDITLPAAATVTGKAFIIKAVDISNTVRILTSEMIDGVASITFLLENESYNLTSDGVNWHKTISYNGSLNLTELANITAGKPNDWNTAYGWGDHANTYLPLSGGLITGDLQVNRAMSIGKIPASNVKFDIGGFYDIANNVAYGILNRGAINGTVTNVWYNRTVVSLGASADITTLLGYGINQLPHSGTVTNQYAFFVESNWIGASGINVGFNSNIPSGSGRWNFYAVGTADNYFAGDTGFGLSNPSEKLDVVGNIKLTGVVTASGGNSTNWNTAYDYSQVGHLPLSGGTITGNLTVNDLMSIGKAPASNVKFDIGGIYDIANDVVYGILNRGTINDTVTNTYYNRTVVTLGASADITTITGYFVSQASYAGIVTNQYGFYVEGNWIGATGNNIGFVGNILSGSGRWNFYAGGDADNYFEGNTGFGLSNPAEKVHIVGNLKIDGVTSSFSGSGNAVSDILLVIPITVDNPAHAVWLLTVSHSTSLVQVTFLARTAVDNKTRGNLLGGSSSLGGAGTPTLGISSVADRFEVVLGLNSGENYTWSAIRVR